MISFAPLGDYPYSIDHKKMITDLKIVCEIHLLFINYQL